MYIIKGMGRDKMILWAIFSYFLIIFGEITRDRKISKWGGGSLFVLMFIVNALRYSGADMGVYKYQFEVSEDYDWDFWNGPLVKENQQFAFLWLNKILNMVGFDFDIAHFFIVSLAMVMLWCLVQKATRNWPVFFAIYFIFPFSLDVVQTRNFFMSLCIGYAVWYLAHAVRHQYSKYVAWNILGVGFHTSGAFYLLFLIFNKIKDFKITKIIATPWATFCFLTPFFYPVLKVMATQILYLVAIPGTPLEALSAYTIYADGITSDDDAKDPARMFLSAYNTALGSVIVAFMIYRYISNKMQSYADEQRLTAVKDVCYAKTVLSICVFMFLLIPLCAYTPSMERFPRDLLLSIYLLFSVFWGYLRQQVRNVLLLSVSMAFVAYLLFTEHGMVTFALREFSYNWLFDLLGL